LKTPEESAREIEHFVMGITVETAAGSLPSFDAGEIDARAHHLALLDQVVDRFGTMRDQSAGAPAATFCISDGPTSKLTITLWPVARWKAPATSRTPETTPMPASTVSSAATAAPGNDKAPLKNTVASFHFMAFPPL
jgi:hypothetical protein